MSDYLDWMVGMHGNNGKVLMGCSLLFYLVQAVKMHGAC
jgi:hypothetical protein